MPFVGMAGAKKEFVRPEMLGLGVTAGGGGVFAHEGSTHLSPSVQYDLNASDNTTL